MTKSRTVLLLALLAVAMFVALGCRQPTAPEFTLDGKWTFEVTMATLPLTWTMEAEIQGDRGQGHIVWEYNGETGEAWTGIRQIMVTGTSAFFYEGGCDYLMQFLSEDHLGGQVLCSQYQGTVEGFRHD